ncbi:MAG: glycoside hydrolase family 71/99-like protein [Pirellulaceae bacterium]|nr:glycoside hydrolase family 71/99-like protein [Pirellulaceae bacterium]
MMQPTRIAVAAFLLVSSSIPLQGRESSSPNTTASQPALIMVHYMPWYEARTQPEYWGWHWTMNHFDPSNSVRGKRSIASHFYPLIGAYDSGDRNVLRYHFSLMKLSGIDGIIIDWYGLKDFRDYKLLHRNTALAIELAGEYGLQVAICYEDQTVPILVEAKRLAPQNRVSHVVQELRWLNDQWFQRENYLKLDNLPVLLSFGQTGLSSTEWGRVIQELNSDVLYLSQHHRRPVAVGAFDWPIPSEGVRRQAAFNRESSRWKYSMPVAFPRFRDIYSQAQLHESYGEIPDRNGKTFQETLDAASGVSSELIQIATWNDWGEGTQIEPSLEYGYRDLKILQAHRSRRISKGPKYKEDALMLPLKLFKLRTASDPPPAATLMAIEKNMFEGEVEIANRRLESLQAERPKN